MLHEDFKTAQRLEEAVSAAKLLNEMCTRHMRRTMTARQLHRRQNPGTELLPLWGEDALSKEELISYVEAVTDEKNKNYIPPRYRIAVSDMDGTLFCETDPTYFDFKVLMYRVLEDPDYRNMATEQERTVVRNIQHFIDTGEMAPGLEIDAGKAIASSFSGMTVAEFNEYVRKRGEEPAPGYNGMKAGDAFYRPMLQVLDYLQEHGFSVYICSGTDRMVIREIVSGVDIAPNRVIGTDERIVARDQGKTKDMDYYFTDNDELVLGGELLNKNLQMSKVSMIEQEIGQQPVLCFGNSSGDISMAKYVTNRNPYPTRVFMLCCDDTEREAGKPEKAEKMRALCSENNWVPVSMKNDWKTIYGFDVTKKTGGRSGKSKS